MSGEDVFGLLIRKLAKLYPLSPEDEAAIVALPHRLEDLDARSFIIRQGDRATHSCLLLTGFACRSKKTGRAARQILSIHIPGDMVDLHNSMLHFADHSVQMLTRGSVAYIPREAISALAFDRPAVGRAMWIETLLDGSIFREWLLNNGRRDARSRIAHMLCEFALRLTDAGLTSGGGFILPMTQVELADATGLTPIHVNRRLRELHAEGIIRSDNRTVSIVEWDRLREIGDFDPAYLHYPPGQIPRVRLD
ncbi:Crp/Fnr family transcriptional regulator [Sphingomonas solaris]|uniref:Crp/Fnr family transcriptional regulator n=1 Tax=Alterirhizorhabdus solaris TaxID=2529389 RepID=A0A558R6M2_9SPHN|nr:Crp/Fnr family transcriptional regulator [Sphingomonas solaris]TVV75030.1 Crp/Fnr family transcriptional regulator [Sphingomonas solaris]